jgi:hypothetical protein
MMRADYFVWGVTGVLAAMILGGLLLSPNARLRRRLKKTHSRIKSTGRQPTVKFSVKTPKEK